MDQSTTRALLRWLMIAAFGAALAYLFFGEHRVHLLGYLPFIFLLACPLLHMTMHGGHGRHGDGVPPPQPDAPPQRPHEHQS